MKTTVRAMDCSRKFCRPRASSLVESVIALTIISICLYIAVLVFGAVFTPKQSAKFYEGRHAASELFFIAQISGDSLASDPGRFKYEEEQINAGLKKITVHYRDSINNEFENHFYVDEN